MSSPKIRLAALALAATAGFGGLAACGGDNSSSSSGATTTAAAATIVASAFPVTIPHKYGSTTIDAEPTRVVTVGFNDQDAILALGVVPVGIRDWYGDQPDAVWPWAHDLLQGAKPTVLPSDDLNYEAVAGLKPDVILGISSGMTQEEYTKLSAIAPTLTQPKEFLDYGTPWQDQTRMIGQALGKSTQAEAMIASTEKLLADAKAANPAFVGPTAVVGYTYGNGTIGGYGPQDIRSRLLTSLGFTINPAVAERAGDKFYADFSAEEIRLLDSDALVWIAGSPAESEGIRNDPLRAQLTAYKEGREIFLDTADEAGAASFSSVLSLPFLLKTLVPDLAAAVDGDPATNIP